MEKQGDVNKKFNPHSIDEQGQAVSFAEECARLLRNGREKGVESYRKSKKREDHREIRNRYWWVEKTKDKDLKKLKYQAADFERAPMSKGGSHNNRYHVFCCLQMGPGRLAMRRIP